MLACEPTVLVLDEPTSDLDPRGRREFKALLRQIAATKLIATHDLEMVVELCSRAIVLDHGAVVADGPVAELLNNEELMLAHGLERPHILRHMHPHGGRHTQVHQKPGRHRRSGQTCCFPSRNHAPKRPEP